MGVFRYSSIVLAKVSASGISNTAGPCRTR
jgi:hypothetical protein